MMFVAHDGAVLLDVCDEPACLTQKLKALHVVSIVPG